MINLPDHIVVCGEQIPIVSDFRAVLEWYSIAKRNPWTDNATRYLLLVDMLCLEEPANKIQAAEELNKFVMCGEPLVESDEEPCICFVQDYKYLWAGFRRVYGIDIRMIPLHWWEFMWMLGELPEDTQLKQIMHIRAMPYPDPSKEPERYADVCDLKHQYRIKGGEYDG